MAVAGDDFFSVTFSRDQGTVVVHVEGELDSATAPSLGAALAGLIDDQGSLSVRVDLSGTTFIDSTGLSVLVDGLSRVRDKGGELTLANPRPSTRKVFQMVGFHQLFDITPQEVGSSERATFGSRL